MSRRRAPGALARLLLLGLALTGCARSPEPTPGWAIRVLEIAPERLEAETRRAAKRSRGEGRRVLVYYQAGWCRPCEGIKAAFQDPAQRARFERWVLIPVDVDHLPSGPSLGLRVDAIPLLVKLTGEGEVAGTLDGTAFVASEGPAEVGAVLERFLDT